MPIRTASLSKQIEKNGAKLHLAMMSRAHSRGADQEASDIEQGLLEERKLLKQAQADRQAQAKLPKPKAAKLEKVAKPAKAPKAKKEPKEPKEAKAAQSNKPSRAEKHAQKAEKLEAAKRATKKSAKT